MTALCEDIIRHYKENRQDLLTGKAMIVAYSRPIGISIYRKLLALRPEWTEKLGVVMTDSNTDPEDWHDVIGNKHHRDEMAKRFKDDEDPMKIAIVVDMWLTGFDVPSLATMYIYKPMKGHNLMQAMKKVLLGVFVLLLCVTGAQAATFTTDDIQYPIFPWGDYTLEIVQVTDDPDADLLPPDLEMPSQGGLVTIEFQSYNGLIPYDMIESSLSEFGFSDANGSLCPRYAWEGYGLDGMDQAGFFLHFNTPRRFTLAESVLYIGDPDASERVFVQMPSEKTEPAAEEVPVEDPVVEESLDISPIVVFVSQLLQAQAETVTNAWERAIYEAGAVDVTLDDDVVSFKLRSFDPSLKGLDETADNYFDQINDNITAYNLEISFKVTANEEDGSFSAKKSQHTKMTDAVTAQAKSSRYAFGNDAMITVITPLLGSNRILEDYQVAWFAPLLAAQKSFEIDTKGGPHSLVFSMTGVTSDDLLQAGEKQSLSDLGCIEGVTEWDYDALESAIIDTFSAKAHEIKRNGKTTETFTFNLDDLFTKTYASAGEFEDFADAYCSSFGEMVDNLTQTVWNDFPPYPLQEMPPGGKISGSTSGTKVIFKAGTDDYYRYMQIRNADTEEIVATFWVNPLKRATTYVPKGSYVIYEAIGTNWYGEAYLFGDNGIYVKSYLDVPSANYYVTVTLSGVMDGNMPSFGVSADDFN